MTRSTDGDYGNLPPVQSGPPIWNPTHETFDAGYPSAVPQSDPKPQHAKRDRPFYKRPLFWVVMALVLIAVFSCVGVATSVSDDINRNVQVTAPAQPGQAGNAMNDVTLAKSTVDQLGLMSTRLTVINHDTKVRSYAITLGYFDAAGTQIAEGLGAVNNLNPGKKASTTVSSLTEAPAGKWTVKVLEVTRV